MLPNEPLICSQGGVPYNKSHLDAKDEEIERLKSALVNAINERDIWRERALSK